MQEHTHTLTSILNSIFTHKDNQVKKRLIYNKSFLGGIHSRWIKLLFAVLPFAMYGAIFNPTSFEALGIAQAIVFYIILLVMAMQIVIGISYFNNRNVIKSAIKSWEYYFPSVDFKMILSSGVTPYVDFKKYYEEALKESLDEDALHKRLIENFRQMEKENPVLIEAIQREKKKQEEKNNDTNNTKK